MNRSAESLTFLFTSALRFLPWERGVTPISAHRFEVNKFDADVNSHNVLTAGEDVALEAPVVRWGPLNGVDSVDCFDTGWLRH